MAINKTDSNVNSTSNVAHQSNNSANTKLYFKRGEERLRIQCDYSKYEKGELKEYKNAYISTSGEILVEAGKQFTHASFPFSTIIVIDYKGYYSFT